jgi:hypothetical protein
MGERRDFGVGEGGYGGRVMGEKNNLFLADVPQIAISMVVPHFYHHTT